MADYKSNIPRLPARTSELMANAHPSRRAFLLATAAATAGATLGAWVPRSRAAGTIGGEVEMMAWEGYTMQNEAADFIAKNNIDLRPAIMGNQDDVTSKLVGDNPVRLDMVEYSNGYGAQYDELKIMQPLDLSKIPNYNAESMFPPFYEADMWRWDDETWSIPWVWGLDTLIYNPDTVPFEIKSYKDLLRPELTGRVAMLDNPLTTFPQIAKVAGYGDKYPLLTADEMADCFEKLKPYRDQTKVYATSNGDVVSLFTSGEIDACFCVWNGVTVSTTEQNVRTIAADPIEGGAVWADSWFIPHTAENLDTVHALINEALSPEVQAGMCTATASNTVSPLALPLMSDDAKQYFDYANFKDEFAKLKIYGLPPLTSDEHATYADWIQAWADFRAGF